MGVLKVTADLLLGGSGESLMLKSKPLHPSTVHLPQQAHHLQLLFGLVSIEVEKTERFLQYPCLLPSPRWPIHQEVREISPSDQLSKVLCLLLNILPFIFQN